MSIEQDRKKAQENFELNLKRKLTKEEEDMFQTGITYGLTIMIQRVEGIINKK